MADSFGRHRPARLVYAVSGRVCKPGAFVALRKAVRFLKGDGFVRHVNRADDAAPRFRLHVEC
ncbi:MAG: hypothetical protein H7Y38_11660 [Armatimonadetes bacterium]|nr:hypothetical protein [Armatimonadota bacterium]